MNYQQHIEAIIFSAQQAVSLAELHLCLQKIEAQALQKKGKTASLPTTDTVPSMATIEEAIVKIKHKYADDAYAFQLVTIEGGYQFLSKPAYHKSIATYLNQKRKKRLSNSAMETLAIIAYKQPITKVEMEQIRGVNCDYSVQKLLEKELIQIVARSDKPGKPLLYGTGKLFKNYFGINRPEDLPKLKDIQVESNEIGTPND